MTEEIRNIVNFNEDQFKIANQYAFDKLYN
jgi:hypothetical protein